jgi:hypothetical protein
MGRSDHPKRSTCPISFALEIFGDRWTLLVLRDLLLKSRSRYRELLACEEGIATTLADRLKRLAKRTDPQRQDQQDARQYVSSQHGDAQYRADADRMTGARNSGIPVDRDLFRRFDKDREQLIADLQAQVRRDGGLE